MTKRSLIHPTLKTALGSLDLELEAEINRYQQHKTGLVKQPKQTNQPEMWENSVTIAAREIPVISIKTEPNTSVLNVFKQPLGVASLVITALASSILGLNLSQPTQIEQSLSTPPLVEGLNLAKQEIELNLQTIPTLPNPNPQLAQQVIPNPVSTPEKQQQSQLVNKLLPRLE